MAENVNTVNSDEKTHDSTFFKSAYFYGDLNMQCFLNHNYGGHGAFGVVIRKGKYSTIYNFKKDETIPILKGMISKLTHDELVELKKLL